MHMLKNEKKVFFIFLTAILACGVFLRLTNFTAEGYSHDALKTLSEGLAYFYDYPGDPSGIQAYPPLGNIIMASTCLMSGEDFSGVEKVPHYFYPAMWEYVARSTYNAIAECHFAVRFFSIASLFIFAFLCMLLFDRFLSLIPITIYTLAPYILHWSRVVHHEAIQWPLTFLGLIFLYKGYACPDKKREFRFFLIGFFILALTTSVKWTTGVYVVLAFFLYLQKNFGVFARNIEKIRENKKFLLLKSAIGVIKNSVVYGIVTYLGVTLVFKFNIFNLLRTYGYWQMRYGEYGGFSLSISRIIQNLFAMFLYVLSPVEALLIPLVVVFLVIIIRKAARKELRLSAKHRFILALFLVYFFTMTQELVGSEEIFRTILFYIPFFILFGICIDFFIRKYLPRHKSLLRYVSATVFLIAYLVINANNFVPYSLAYRNPVMVPLTPVVLGHEGTKDLHLGAMLEIVEYDQIRKDIDALNMSENETIWGERQIMVRVDERYPDYVMRQQLKQEYGREPTLKERINLNINPLGRKYRYMLVTEPDMVEGINATLLKTYSVQGRPYFYLYEVQ